jgi:hypothetical protein
MTATSIARIFVPSLALVAACGARELGEEALSRYRFNNRWICRGGDPHQFGRRQGRQPTAIEPRQYINPIQLSLAHQHHTHRIRSHETS